MNRDERPWTPAALAGLLRDPQQLAALDLPSWDMLIRLARRANVLGLLATTAERLPADALPPCCRPHIAAGRALAARQARAVRWEIECLRKALDTIGVPLVLLKGAAYLAADLPFARGRFFSDVDILVPRSRIDEVEAALMRHGWATTHHDAYDQRYYRQWMHELPPMRHMRRGTVVDVHHRILPLTARFDPDPATMLEQAAPVPDLDGVFVLSPADMLLHSATHLYHEGELPNGYRDLLDLDGLFQHLSAEHPAAFAQLDARADVLNLKAPLAFARRQCASLLYGASSSLGHKPSSLSSQLTDLLHARALVPHHVVLDSTMDPVARWLLYVRAHWLRMPPLLLVRHLVRKYLTNTSRRPP
ncbi:nucleotidyltransferase family protein [Thauera sp. CAU 1555]|uniref:Nucleotidyltransferase family protein n=1 Tax=Thauera sedimentorum TaxID=2767595 RepID=A0ABR9B8I3_9RHOO|nr:nucleotidyltransferase family protein [Thauera sedimentorum]MBC9070552.1 nucleotidyltransferase family protein [Thauera sedimentorum]MBD8501471.1 nucleotidyltransferase family protein [Thauera sedimentorum]